MHIAETDREEEEVKNKCNKQPINLIHKHKSIRII
jgi:hypothetical protein